MICEPLLLFLMPHSQNSLERFSKLRIEDGVNKRIQTRVDVSEEGCGLECKVPRRGIEVVLDTEGIQDVAGKEGNPANQKSC